MFEFLSKKKRKGPGKPDDEESEKIEAPNAEDAMDDIDLALQQAASSKKRDLELERERLLEMNRPRGFCGC
jgi:hypothetical protein